MSVGIAPGLWREARFYNPVRPLAPPTPPPNVFHACQVATDDASNLVAACLVVGPNDGFLAVDGQREVAAHPLFPHPPQLEAVLLLQPLALQLFPVFLPSNNQLPVQVNFDREGGNFLPEEDFPLHPVPPLGLDADGALNRPAVRVGPLEKEFDDIAGAAAASAPAGFSAPLLGHRRVVQLP